MDYFPPPAVRDFIVDEHFYNFIVGPVGSGKTVGIIMKILHHAQLQAPDPEDGIRKTKWVVVRNTLQQLKDTTLSSFFSWFPPGVAGKWVAGENKFIFRFDDVLAEVLFRPLDSPDDVRRVLSLEVTGAILDEFVEMPREIIESLSGRCGRYPPKIAGGATWWGMWGASNPGNQDNWWYDWLYEPWDEQLGDKDEKLGYHEQPSGFSEYAENIDNLPGGNDYYTNLAVGKTIEWVRQFIEVKWGYSLSGKPVYPEFNRELHVAAKPLAPIKYAPILIGFDAGLTPSAIIGQQTADGRLLVLREIISEGMGAKRFCSEMLGPALRAYEGLTTEVLLVGDPAFTQRAQTDEKTVMQVIQKELPTVAVVPAKTNVLAARLEAVSTHLTRLTGAGPAILIDPSCKTLIAGFTSGYKYNVDRKGTRAPTPSKNNYSHPHDAMQYLALEVLGEVRSPQARKARNNNITFSQGVRYV